MGIGEPDFLLKCQISSRNKVVPTDILLAKRQQILKFILLGNLTKECGDRMQTNKICKFCFLNAW